MVGDLCILQRSSHEHLGVRGMDFGGAKAIFVFCPDRRPLSSILFYLFEHLFRDMQGVLHLENAQHGRGIHNAAEWQRLQRALGGCEGFSAGDIFEIVLDVVVVVRPGRDLHDEVLGPLDYHSQSPQRLLSAALGILLRLSFSVVALFDRDAQGRKDCAHRAYRLNPSCNGLMCVGFPSRNDYWKAKGNCQKTHSNSKDAGPSPFFSRHIGLGIALICLALQVWRGDLSPPAYQVKPGKPCGL